MSKQEKFVGALQFTHPGCEHSRGVILPRTDFCFKRWNYTARHMRKYIRCVADLVDTNGRLCRNKRADFWGEWEPESISAPIGNVKGKGLPDNIHYPVFIKNNLEYAGKDKLIKKVIEEKKKETKNAKGLQNTDPFVFGDNFYYTCCKQAKTKRLAPGSVILFGSTFQDPYKYVVDTVFVISEIIDCTWEGIEKYKDCGLFYDAVLHKIYYGSHAKEKGENWLKGNKIIVGASYEKPYNGMYSFFPCHPSTNKETYKRPEIDSSLHDEISSSIESTKYIVRSGMADTKAFWEKLRDYLLEQGYCLGVRTELPPILAPEEVPEYIKTLD